MTAKQYEIFSSANGHVYDVCFGRDNAILRAKALAQKHQMPVGISEDEGPAEYFPPVIAKAWKQSATTVRNWEYDGWSDTDYDEMTRQAEALRCFVVDIQNQMSSGGSFTPDMLRATSDFIRSKAARLYDISQAYV